jgi:7-cyano-7-deazaguanine synthase
MQPKRQSVCALVSGGLDSCVMLAELAAGRICHSEQSEESLTVFPVFIRCGLRWEEAELRHLRRSLRALSPSAPRSPVRRLVRRSFCEGGSFSEGGTLHALTILSLPVLDLYGSHWSTTGRRVPGKASPDMAVYLPGRNLLLLSKAAVFCARHNIGIIAIGSLRGNPFPDATPKFFREFAAVAGDALGCRLKIVAPFRGLTKAQVIRRGVKLGLPLHLSFSCLSPKRGIQCGSCNKCAERQKAFAETGVEDNTNYAR